MPYQVPITIKQALDQIQRQHYVLPAIQREFVWTKEQIAQLFDSLLRGYPIGSFLFWVVEGENVGKYKYYGFVKDYHQLKSPHCPVLDLPAGRSVTAILDGQQRLTALNIGLRGAYAAKLPWKWERNPSAYPEQRLYLNLCAEAPEDNMQMLHDFRFFAQPPASDPANGVHWFPVHLMFDPAMGSLKQANAYLIKHNLGAAGDRPIELLDALYKAVHVDSPISYYEEKDQDLDRVLHIFTRANSGGTVLSHSDLLLSIATAQWQTLDAREEIQEFVDELNDVGQRFSFTKDVVLKAGLMLTGKDVGFQVKNFDRLTMATLEQRWAPVKAALLLTVQLLADFGYSGDTLTANSVVHPLAHYAYRRGLDGAYLTSGKFAGDRAAVRTWVARTLVKPGVWGSGLDTLLRDLRTVLDESALNGFPVEALEAAMARRGKSLSFSLEEILDFVETPYRDKRAFPLLALLFPTVRTNHQFHVDHVYPRALFRRPALVKDGVGEQEVEEYQRRSECLPNLQLLEGQVNQEKLATPPLSWAKAAFAAPEDLAHYLHEQELQGLSDDLEAFRAFYEARKDRLVTRLCAALGVAIPQVPEEVLAF